MDFDVFYSLHRSFLFQGVLIVWKWLWLSSLYKVFLSYTKEIRTILFTYFAFYKNLFYNLYKIIIYEFGRIKVRS